MPSLHEQSAPSASSSVRALALVYCLLVVYASCHPFSGWQDIGLSPLAYLWAPLPHYRTVFDQVANVLAYVPLGTLIVLALYPRVKNASAVLLAIAGGALLSGTVEAIQTFLPSRVPSNLDLLANIGGTTIGAAVGPALARSLLQRGSLLPLRRRWFTKEASHGLVALLLWPLAQIYPQAYLFGHGHFLPIISAWLSAWLSHPVNLSLVPQLGAEQYWLLESFITACGLSGALLTVLSLLRTTAPKHFVALGLLIAAICIKSLSSAFLFTSGHAFVWLTPGAKGGLLVGFMLLLGLASAPPATQRRMAIVALLLGLVAVNAAPVNPYFASTLQTWVQGPLLNFNGAAQFLSLAWPFFTLWFLLVATHRGQKPS